NSRPRRPSRRWHCRPGHRRDVRSGDGAASDPQPCGPVPGIRWQLLVLAERTGRLPAPPRAPRGVDVARIPRQRLHEPPAGEDALGAQMSMLSQGSKEVAVYTEIVVEDEDGNTLVLPSTEGVPTPAMIRVQAQSGTSARRSEQMDDGFFTEEV